MSRKAHLAIVCALSLALTSTGGRAELPERIANVLEALDIPETDVSIVIERADDRTPVLSHLPVVPRNPASVMKLVTTYSALELLGPAYVWPTEVYFLGRFDGQILDGDLAFKGYGDPFLVQEELWKLLRRLRRIGLEQVTGDFVFDDSYFDVHEPPPGQFDAQPARTYNVVPNSLLMNFKAVQFQFRPDLVRGGVRLALEPPLRNVSIENNLSLGAGRCGGYQRGISFNYGISDQDRVVLDGEFSRNCNVYSMTRSVLDHDTYAYGLFRSLWGELGGRLEGRMRHEAVAETAEPSLVWTSRPLAEILRSINKNSNNVMTRQLLYTIAAEQRGAPGVRENGVAAINEFLRSRELDTESLVIVNGAGLSRDARISAQLLVDMLQASRRSPWSAEFVASLSIGGLDGTTRGRYDTHAGRGLTHVKTGRLDDVSALAGFAHAADGTDYVMSIFVNTPEAHRGLGQEVEKAVLGWLFAQ
ncbi:MAG: D-alanyl-D-alanine carboxypeptidase/D-alanyl-D-alanine-endopeptidase [Gammaproteobacteria bacterium]